MGTWEYICSIGGGIWTVSLILDDAAAGRAAGGADDGKNDSGGIVCVAVSFNSGGIVCMAALPVETVRASDGNKGVVERGGNVVCSTRGVVRDATPAAVSTPDDPTTFDATFDDSNSGQSSTLVNDGTLNVALTGFERRTAARISGTAARA